MKTVGRNSTGQQLLNGLLRHKVEQILIHAVEQPTEGGDRKDPGCNLELIPQPIGGEAVQSNMQHRLVEYFRSLEAALDEHKEKGTPAGDPVYDKTYKQLAQDLAAIGVGQDQIEALAEQCGHGSTVARLQKLRKRPIGFSS